MVLDQFLLQDVKMFVSRETLSTIRHHGKADFTVK